MHNQLLPLVTSLLSVFTLLFLMSPIFSNLLDGNTFSTKIEGLFLRNLKINTFSEIFGFKKVWQHDIKLKKKKGFEKWGT